ncbi:hypothetical protein IAQ61_007632 [Plenodomus lingam]|uniref:uncharacterized protein n=1 Tax=Leptosphaeria maculans TaxID=5022 RepID=UPI00333291E2|nr:hypothetical protein IAQ61_007632 [Plenodomus lingam]
MASNDYYNTSYTPTGQPHSKNDAALPPVPSNQTQYSVSPISASPFDDRPYPPNTSSGALGGYPDHYSTLEYNPHAQYSSAPQVNDGQNRYDSPGPGRHPDPFADQNAIALRPQPAMDDQSSTQYSQDPERYGLGVEPARKHRKKKQKEGWFSGRITWVVYLLTTVQIGVFVGELIKNGILTGSPIQTKPNFNIMIGPSPYVTINMGARFTPCMHNIRKVIDNRVTNWPCPNTTSLDPASLSCSLGDLCGFSGVSDQTDVTDFRDRSREPNQWWRFIVPIFLHAGLIHIGFNMLLQLTLGRDMEKEIGPLRFTLVYFAAGIFGFVLGGNYAADGLASVGASGSLFGILALTLLDLLYNWSTRRSPVKDLLFLLLDVAIAFVLGLLPGLDNFSHIGGFLMGLVLGICLLHSPESLRARTGTDEPPYATVDTQPLAPTATETKSKFAVLTKSPLGFFKGRKPLWWAWWLVRAGGLVAVFIGFILLLRNFYEWRNTCSWCKHLTCLPITTNGVSWCDIGGLSLTDGPAQNNTRRALESGNMADFVTGAASLLL